MRIVKKSHTLLLALLMAGTTAMAQNEGSKVQVHGSLHTEFLTPQKDEAIGTENTSEKLQNVTYADASLTSKYVDAGVRFEYLQHPLPGFEKDFKGWGLPHFYARGKYNGMELTVGDIYEQFGSGFILRAYEERSLGIDNAIRGAKLKVASVKGLRLTALGGVQRRYWNWDTSSKVFGADAEVDLSTFIPKLEEKGITWMVGGSWTLKNEKKPTADEPIFVPGTAYFLNVPQNVNAFDVRTQFNKGGVSILGEYAWKTDDPSHDNGYTFNRGSVAMLSASYSKSGFAALVQAKRSEDMSFRSQRAMTGISAFINHMPAFAYQHTYALAALYPYATQYCNISENGATLVPGEWAFQAELAYTFKRKTALGGKYGTKIKVNFSHIRGLDSKLAEGATLPDGSQNAYTYGGKGYKTSFFKMGDCFYQDINVQLEKKFSKVFKLNFMYMNQLYNQPVIEQHGTKMRNNIIVFDGRLQMSEKATLRLEYQHLFAKSDYKTAYTESVLDPTTGLVVSHKVPTTQVLEESKQPGDWDYILAELTVLPYLMFTVSDQIGKPFFSDGYHKKENYLMGMVTFTHKSHRLSAGYGRTRAGYNCSGGVCRWVPASKGFKFTYNYTF